MRVFRSLAAGAVIAGAAAGLSLLSAGSAAAIGITPYPGGVAVQLTHEETAWAHQAGVGAAIAALPHPAAESFGVTFASAAELALEHPKGRVGFTAEGPLDNPGGLIVAYKE